jgi:uncharacterized protein (DUF488 family)
MTLFTIGHSTRPIEATIALLRAHGVARVIDIRTVPGSRRWPQYGQAALAGALEAAGIRYEHRKALGGLRRPAPDSPNTAWRNASFRGYADYMRTDPFWDEARALAAAAAREPVAILCAEAVPWRCHRSLVADALATLGVEARHIMSEREARPHAMTPFARVHEGRIVYDGPADAKGARRQRGG